MNILESVILYNIHALTLDKVSF